jgi:hypothetical protein
MPARKARFLRKAASVLLTSFVLPLLVSMSTQEVTSWEKALQGALEPEPAAATADERPHIVKPLRATASANDAESSPAKTPLDQKFEERLRAPTSHRR